MISVNGTDLASLGFYPRLRSPIAIGGRRHSILEVPGGMPIRAGETISAGRITVDGTLRATDHATLLARLDALALLLQGENSIRFDDFGDREWVGYLEESSRLAIHDPQWIQRTGALSLVWSLPDPRARARTETTRTGSGALVLGSAPSPLRIEVAAAAVTVRVRAGGASGTILTELVWTGSSGALVIDGETQTVSLDGDNAIDGITAASVFPVADPALGADYVEVPAGATVTYRRRWW